MCVCANLSRIAVIVHSFKESSLIQQKINKHETSVVYVVCAHSKYFHFGKKQRWKQKNQFVLLNKIGFLIGFAMFVSHPYYHNCVRGFRNKKYVIKNKQFKWKQKMEIFFLFNQWKKIIRSLLAFFSISNLLYWRPKLWRIVGNCGKNRFKIEMKMGECHTTKLRNFVISRRRPQNPIVTEIKICQSKWFTWLTHARRILLSFVRCMNCF